MELRKDLQAQAQHHALAASIHPSQQHTVRDSSPGLQRSYSAGQFATTSTWPVALEKPPRPASILSSNPVATHSRPMAQSMAPPIHPYSKVNVNGRGGSAHQVDPQRQYTSNATDKPYEPIPDEFDGRVNDSADQVDSQTHFYAPGVTDKPYLVHPMNCMDHANEWVKCVENCSMQSCGDDCSVSRCTFGCTDSEDCDGSGACTSLDCAESSYPHSFSPCLDESCQLTSFGHAPGFGDDFSNQNFDAGDNDMQCLWLMPGQQCGVSVSTRNALGKHVFHDHIEPQEIVICPVETCAAVIKAQQAPSHLMQQHNPESYACPVQFCGGLFLNHEELDNHLTTTHGLLDCHWAGCEVSTKNSIQLSRHISLDHLNSTGRFQPPQFSWWDQSNVPSQVHEHPTLQFTPQSFASPQVSPFDDDRKDTAEEGSASPFINIFTSSMSSGQPASLSNESTSSMSPYRGGFPHTSPTATKFNGSPYLDREAEGTTQFKNPLHHEPEGNVEPGTDGEKSKCMWVTGGVTGQVCGMTFPDGNALQLHTDQCHVWPIGDKGTKTVLSCDWQNCKRKGKLLQNKEKLRRHLFTHTGCTYSPDVAEPLQHV